MSSACSFVACCTAEEDFERVETVHVYTTPHRIPEADLTPAAPADLTVSQEVNSTFAQEDAIPWEKAVSAATVFHPELAVSASDCSQDQTYLESHVPEQSQGVPALSNTLQDESVISFQPQASSVVSDQTPSLADTADKSSDTLRQPAPGKPAAIAASQKAQVLPAP